MSNSDRAALEQIRIDMWTFHEMFKDLGLDKHVNQRQIQAIWDFYASLPVPNPTVAFGMSVDMFATIALAVEEGPEQAAVFTHLDSHAFYQLGDQRVRSHQLSSSSQHENRAPAEQENDASGRWQIKLKRSWRDYEPEFQAQLTQQWRDGPQSRPYTIYEVDYDIDMVNLIQRNCETRSERKIRWWRYQGHRQPPFPPPPPRPPSSGRDPDDPDHDEPSPKRSRANPGSQRYNPPAPDHGRSNDSDDDSWGNWKSTRQTAAMSDSTDSEDYRDALEDYHQQAKQSADRARELEENRLAEIRREKEDLRADAASQNAKQQAIFEASQPANVVDDEETWSVDGNTGYDIVDSHLDEIWSTEGNPSQSEEGQRARIHPHEQHASWYCEICEMWLNVLQVDRHKRGKKHKKNEKKDKDRKARRGTTRVNRRPYAKASSFLLGAGNVSQGNALEMFCYVNSEYVVGVTDILALIGLLTICVCLCIGTYWILQCRRRSVVNASDQLDEPLIAPTYPSVPVAEPQPETGATSETSSIGINTEALPRRDPLPEPPARLVLPPKVYISAAIGVHGTRSYHVRATCRHLENLNYTLLQSPLCKTCRDAWQATPIPMNLD